MPKESPKKKAKTDEATPTAPTVTARSPPAVRRASRKAASAAVAAAQPTTAKPPAAAAAADNTGTIGAPPPLAPPQQAAHPDIPSTVPLPAPVLRVAPVPGRARKPFKTSVGDQHRLKVAAADLPALTEAQGPILLMLSADPKYPPKAYIDKDNTTVSYYVDLARQLPNGKMASLFVVVRGQIASVAIARLNDTLPTLRMQVHEDDLPHLQELCEACVRGLSTPSSRTRLLAGNKGPKNDRKRHTKCTYGKLTADVGDTVWFNSFDSNDVCIYAINPDTGKLRRKPEWFQDRGPVDDSFEGLPIQMVCELTLRVAAPLSEHPQSKATVSFKWTARQMVLQGEDPHRGSNFSFHSLGLEMDDDAPQSDDDEFPGVSTQRTHPCSVVVAS
jgi:hypothetical protein